MKRVLAALLAVSALGVALPAAADDHRDDRRFDDRRWEDRWDRRDDRRWDDRRGDERRWDDRRGDGRRGYDDRLDDRIDVGVRTGRLTRSEAARLYAELNAVSRLERLYARDGLSRWERQDLDRRYDRLAGQVRWESRDDDRRYDYGYRR